MENFKRNISINGKYPKLKFVEGDLYEVTKDGLAEPVDLLEDLYSVYGSGEEVIFSLTTKAAFEEDV